jgi:hypothetical protein
MRASRFVFESGGRVMWVVGSVMGWLCTIFPEGISKHSTSSVRLLLHILPHIVEFFLPLLSMFLCCQFHILSPDQGFRHGDLDEVPDYSTILLHLGQKFGIPPYHPPRCEISAIFIFITELFLKGPMGLLYFPTCVYFPGHSFVTNFSPQATSIDNDKSDAYLNCSRKRLRVDNIPEDRPISAPEGLHMVRTGS